MGKGDKQERENWMIQFRKFVAVMKEKTDHFEDYLPEDVFEAYQVMLRMGEIFADPDVADKTVREAIFAEIPRERLQWAMDVLDKWQEDIDEEDDE